MECRVKILSDEDTIESGDIVEALPFSDFFGEGRAMTPTVRQDFAICASALPRSL